MICYPLKNRVDATLVVYGIIIWTMTKNTRSAKSG